jgi:hypothetical protein
MFWWILGGIYVVGACWFAYEIKHAPEVPEELADLF